MRIRRHNNKHLLAIAIMWVMFISIIFGVSVNKLETPFFSRVEAYATTLCNNAVEEAAIQALSDIKYSDLVILNENSKGQIISLSADTIKLNQLKARIANSVEGYINNLSKKKIGISLGALCGKPMLSAIGPKIYFKLNPSTHAKVMFNDSFSDAGINQVRHTIYLDIVISITISSSTSKKSYDIHDSMLIADTVIVGTVPDFYLGRNLFEKQEN